MERSAAVKILARATKAAREVLRKVGASVAHQVRSARVKKTYDPDQPRDDRGEWTSGGTWQGQPTKYSSDEAIARLNTLPKITGEGRWFDPSLGGSDFGPEVSVRDAGFTRVNRIVGMKADEKSVDAVLPLKSIEIYQPQVTVAKTEEYIKNPPSDKISVAGEVQSDGSVRWTAASGTHRLVAAAMVGVDSIPARVQIYGKTGRLFSKKRARELIGDLGLGKLAKAKKSKRPPPVSIEPPDPVDPDDVVATDFDLSDLDDLQDDFTDALEAMSVDAGIELLGQVGLDDDEDIVNQVSERAVIAAREQAGELISQVDESTRNMIRDVIADALEDNVGTDELADRIAQSAAFDDDRATLIAHTEVRDANERGVVNGLRAARDAGNNVKKYILLGPNPCEICQENADAGAIDIDEVFPSGDSEPTFHPRCECSVSAVIAEDEDVTTEDEDEDAGDDVIEALARIAKGYDEPRDDRGRWTSGGGKNWSLGDKREERLSDTDFIAVKKEIQDKFVSAIRAELPEGTTLQVGKWGNDLSSTWQLGVTIRHDFGSANARVWLDRQGNVTLQQHDISLDTGARGKGLGGAMVAALVNGYKALGAGKDSVYIHVNTNEPFWDHMRDLHGVFKFAQLVKRNVSDEDRDDRGRWTSGNKEDLPAHIQALRIPPAWKDVTYAKDPSADLLVTGHDAKGRSQAIYSSRFAQSQAAAKFARVQELASKFDAIKSENDANLKSRDLATRDSAAALRLIMSTGLRPGSDDDTGAEKKAYGATTLEGRHVVGEGDEMRLQFVGKKGVDQDVAVPAGLRRDVRARADAAGSGGGGSCFRTPMTPHCVTTSRRSTEEIFTPKISARRSGRRRRPMP